MNYELKKSTENLYYIVGFVVVVFLYVWLFGGEDTVKNKTSKHGKESVRRDVIKIGDHRYIESEWNTAQLYTLPCGVMYTDDKGNVLGKLGVLPGGTKVKIIDIYYNRGNGCPEDGAEWLEVVSSNGQGWLHPRHIIRGQ